MLGRASKALAGAALLAGLSAPPAAAAAEFAEPEPYPYLMSTPGSGQDLAAGDLDGDATAEIVVGVHPPDVVFQPYFSLLANDGDGNFAAPVGHGVGTGEGVDGITVGDADLDGFGDVVTGGRNGVGVFFHSNGALGFDGTHNFERAPDNDGQSLLAPVVAKLDPGPDPDVAIGNEGPSTWYEGDGEGGFGPPHVLSAGVNATNTVAADVDRDRDRDLLVGGFNGSGGNGGALALLTNKGNGKFKNTSTVGLGNFGAKVAAADVKGSRKLEVIARAPSEPSVAVYPVKRKGKLGKPKAYPVPVGGGGIAVGDLDEDGLVDVATGGGGAEIAVLRGKPKGGLRAYEGFDSTEAVGDLAVSDLDDDGDLDLAGLGAQVQVLINQAVPTPPGR